MGARSIVTRSVRYSIKIFLQPIKRRHHFVSFGKILSLRFGGTKIIDNSQVHFGTVVHRIFA